MTRCKSDAFLETSSSERDFYFRLTISIRIFHVESNGTLRIDLSSNTRCKSDAFLETSFSECFLNAFITCCNIFITHESFNIHEFSMLCAPIVIHLLIRIKNT